MPTGRQIRAARGFLGWSRRELAEASEVSVATIKDIELGAERQVTHEKMTALVEALENKGIRMGQEHGHECVRVPMEDS